MKMSNKTSAIVRNKALQKKLWGAATQQTELQLAQRAKGDGKLKIIKPLLGASKDKKDKKK